MRMLAAIALTLLFALLVLATYVLHVWYFPVPVVLYSAILDVLIAGAVAVVVLAIVGRKAGFDGTHRLLLVTLWLVGGFAFAIAIPTVLDRSLSFYILEKLQQRGGGIRADAFPNVFVDEYMDEFRLVDVRLTEQEQSGTVTIENGCVRLTPRGNALATFSRFFRLNLLPKSRLLNGVYTDDLVDPFADSKTGKMGYEC